MYIIFQWGNELTPKQRKRALYKKNKHHEQMFQLMRMRRADDQRIKKEEEQRGPKREASKDGKSPGEWSDKVSKIRNRLTGKKRESKERWNRFAGTSGGGGRGL